MREIKFRGWGVKSKVMVDVAHLEWTVGGLHAEGPGCYIEGSFHNGGDLVKDDNIILMQSTGLKDRNGREIYEGDILRKDYTMPGCREFSHIIQVVWMPESCCFGTVPSHPYKFADLSVEKAADYYIAGNIYENADLMEHQ